MTESIDVVRAFLEGRTPESVELLDDTDLIDAEILDSLGIFTLVSHMEESLGISIEAEEVTLENFGTLNDINALIAAKAAT